MDGKHVVKMGRYFFVDVDRYLGDKRVRMSSDIRGAKMFDSVKTAEKIMEDFGGEVMKVDLELKTI